MSKMNKISSHKSSTIKLFKEDFYQRLGGLKQFKDLKVLDVGCGDGEDAFNIAKFAKKVMGIDIYNDPNWLKNKKVKFKIAKAENLPFNDKEFNGLFLKDVLHHVKSKDKTLKEIRRVTTKDAKIILIEGNRYNPLFFIHMTKLKGHEHFSQKYFKYLILKYFPDARFIHFESHFVPFIDKGLFKRVIKVERLLDRISLFRPILSYNAALINS